MKPTLPIIAFILAATAAMPAYALTDAEKAKVQELVDKGTKDYKAGNILDAVDAFEQAADLSDDPRIRYNYARALENAGFCGRAKAQFQQLSGDDTKDKAVRKLSTEKVEVGLECAPMAIVTFDCSAAPQDVEVSLAGKPIACGQRQHILTAEARWTATADGYQRARGTIMPVEGENITVKVALDEIPPPPPSGKPWKLVAGGATAGAGVGLFIVGLVSDSTANKRSQQILDASAAADLDRLDRLEAAADSARTRSLALTISGVTLAAAGGALLYLHFTEESGETSLTVAPGISPDSATVSAWLRW